MAINKNKPSKEEIKAKKLADAEAKAEQKRAKKAAKDNNKKKSKDNSKNNNKSNSKVTELSDIAKEYNIRISTPKGYYPDDVDPIIISLKKEISSLTLDNKRLGDKVHDLENKNKSLSTELSSLKIQMSVMEVPVDIESSLNNLEQIGDISGNKYNDNISEIANSLMDEAPKSTKIKPKIKINMNGGKS